MKDSTAEQLVFVQTVKGNVYYVSGNPMLGAEENVRMAETLTFTMMQKADTHVAYIICVWKQKQVDVPSIAVRKALYELDYQNGDAKIVLNGTVRKLEDCIS